MKKSTIIATGIVCGGLLLLGCTNPSSPANISKKLDYNLTALTNVVNRLDTIENSYLSNPDIHPITTTVSAPAPKPNKQVVAKIGTNDFILSIPIKSHYKNKIANIDTYNEKTTKKSTTNSDNTTNFYYYNVHPIKYSPRHISTQNNENEDYLKHYINKVRTLYSITNDAIEANNELGKFKNDVITYCVEIKQLNSEIENGTFVPSSNQIAALNNYIDDIKVTIKRIKECNGDLSNEVNNINNTDVGGITAGIDVINSNYLSVLNHIDTRISYLKNAITTLEQVKNLLQEAQEIIQNNPSTLEELENNEIIDSTTNSDNIDNNNIDNENAETNQEEDIQNSENNNLATNNDLEDTTNNTDENVTNNSTTENETIIPSENETTENSVPTNTETDNSNENDTETTNTNLDNSSETSNNVENDETVNTSTENEVNEENNNEDTQNEVDNITDINTTETQEDLNDDNQESNSNIDSYLNTNNNLDTYKNTQNTTTETNLDSNIDSTNEDTIINNINTTNPAVTTPIVNGNNTVNNGAILPTDEEKINAPNGTFQNGIITQNNLNNGVNNGVNGTRTGYSGSNNYPYINGDINRTNKNVDTYGYNTMIDMINRGTVNNGINTLTISDESKPTMVNGVKTLEFDEDICENCEDESCEDCNNSLDMECEICEDANTLDAEKTDYQSEDIDPEFNV